MECPQFPPKSRINGSCLCWGDTSLWLLICAPCKFKKSCRTAAVGKPAEGQGMPVATPTFSQIHIQPWAESTWNYKNASWAALKSEILSQLVSIIVSKVTIIFSPLKQHSQQKRQGEKALLNAARVKLLDFKISFLVHWTGIQKQKSIWGGEHLYC